MIDTKKLRISLFDDTGRGTDALRLDHDTCIKLIEEIELLKSLLALSDQRIDILNDRIAGYLEEIDLLGGETK